jgi:hypothetical protein
VIGAGVSVSGSALVFCGCDMWFLGGRNVCAIFFVYYGTMSIKFSEAKQAKEVFQYKNTEYIISTSSLTFN